MPSLPALPDFTQAHYDRIVAAFPGDTLAEKAAAYQAWSINNLITFVENSERMKIETDVAAYREQKFATLAASLPARLPFKTALAAAPTKAPPS